MGLFLLNLEVGIAGDPEGVMGDDLHAGEQRVEMGGDHLLERHEPLTVRHHHEPRQDRRDLDPGEPGHPGPRVAHEDSQVEREVRNVGEGVSRVDRQRRHHGEDPLAELLVQVFPIVVVEAVV